MPSHGGEQKQSCAVWVFTGIIIFIIVMWVVSLLSRCAGSLENHKTVESMSDPDFVVLARGSLGQYATKLSQPALTAAGRTIATSNVRAGKAPGTITLIRSESDANALLQRAYAESRTAPTKNGGKDAGVIKTRAGTSVPTQAAVLNAWNGGTSPPPCESTNWNSGTSPPPLFASQMAPEYAKAGKIARHESINSGIEPHAPSRAAGSALLAKMDAAASKATNQLTSAQSAVEATGLTFSNSAQYFKGADESFRLPSAAGQLPYYAHTKSEAAVETNTGLISDSFQKNEMREVYAGLAPDDAKAMVDADDLKKHLPSAALMKESDAKAFGKVNYDLQRLAAMNPEMAGELLGKACPTNMPTVQRIATATQLAVRSRPTEERSETTFRSMGAGFFGNSINLFTPPTKAAFPSSTCSSQTNLSTAYFSAAQASDAVCSAKQ
jgi:hypothetical protein